MTPPVRGAVWTPAGLLADAVVELDGARIRAVRPPRPGDGARLDGLVVPGLVNAHTHLELAWLGGRVPGGAGFLAWVEALLAARAAGEPPDARATAAAAARDLAELGVAAVCDVSNAGDTPPLLLAAGLSGIVQHELLGLDRGHLPGRLREASAPAVVHADGRARVAVRPTAHAPATTAPELVAAACAPRGEVPASIHLAEDEEELRFLEDGSGAWARFFDAHGIPRDGWRPPGCGPATYLDRLGVLGPSLLAVHGVHLAAEERALLRDRGAALCLCPRSNLHIGGRLPDVPALLEDGVRLCLGTDSHASSPDLDVLGEIPVLAAAFPHVPPEVWLDLATAGGAAALGLPLLGRIVSGAAPGLLLLEGVRGPADLVTVAPARRWLVRPGVP